MTKHSKNNTASSIFSYAEYKKLDYGTKRQRLGNESMRRFDACALCLNRARDPVACQDGHLFCKECIYTDLLSQKKDIKRQKDRLEALKKEAEAEKARAKEAARERVLADFERGQLGLGANVSGSVISTSSSEARGTKRKFSFDTSLAEQKALEAEEDALRQIEREQALALKSKLPDFWLPSLTPTYSSSGPPISLDDVKVVTTCRGGVQSHPLALKNLVPVSFAKPNTTSVVPSTPASEDSTPTKSLKEREEEENPICPSCKKQLSNSVRIFLSKPCGHVTCKTCFDTLVKPAKQCVVCDKELKVEKEIVELKREGTGFAGGGLAETSKSGIAFQG
ncbi:uncharacterized protein STEHIDRAFT_96232 [Stereum hirsutum FP-91666 SS1]|uniref:uncharacterized protein n=1 Tax=Stereum hirsutum (strain FP-91666) TaxID=721885 RepID=UPI000440D48D|nr:uncharacterized protein STEHIDRAFT_96232 [Stereum hirsutum FP-91666 SS1]EIM87209.1 hypothetical protein STEHIDRAFT_96232 [Stereum hirsutum FP-91666 SS1]